MQERVRTRQVFWICKALHKLKFHLEPRLLSLHLQSRLELWRCTQAALLTAHADGWYARSLFNLYYPSPSVFSGTSSTLQHFKPLTSLLKSQRFRLDPSQERMYPRPAHSRLVVITVEVDRKFWILMSSKRRRTDEGVQVSVEPCIEAEILEYDGNGQEKYR